MGSGIWVSDVDKVHLVREAQTKEAHYEHSHFVKDTTASARVTLMTQSAFSPDLTSGGRQRSNKLIISVCFSHTLESHQGSMTDFHASYHLLKQYVTNDYCVLSAADS